MEITYSVPQYNTVKYVSVEDGQEVNIDYETEINTLKKGIQILTNYIIDIETAFKVDPPNSLETMSSIIEFIKENNLSEEYWEWKKIKDFKEKVIEKEISKLESELNGEIPGYIKSEYTNRKEYYKKLKNYVNQLNKIREVMKKKREK